MNNVKGIRYLILFLLSFLLQWLYYDVIKTENSVTMVDMLGVSLLFTMGMFLLESFFQRK